MVLVLAGRERQHRRWELQGRQELLFFLFLHSTPWLWGFGWQTCISLVKRVSSSGPTGFLSDLIKCLGWICLAVEQLQCCYICL